MIGRDQNKKMTPTAKSMLKYKQHKSERKNCKREKLCTVPLCVCVCVNFFYFFLGNILFLLSWSLFGVFFWNHTDPFLLSFKDLSFEQSQEKKKKEKSLKVLVFYLVFSRFKLCVFYCVFCSFGTIWKKKKLSEVIKLFYLFVFGKIKFFLKSYLCFLAPTKPKQKPHFVKMMSGDLFSIHPQQQQQVLLETNPNPKANSSSKKRRNLPGTPGKIRTIYSFS